MSQIIILCMNFKLNFNATLKVIGSWHELWVKLKVLLHSEIRLLIYPDIIIVVKILFCGWYYWHQLYINVVKEIVSKANLEQPRTIKYSKINWVKYDNVWWSLTNNPTVENLRKSVLRIKSLFAWQPSTDVFGT